MNKYFAYIRVSTKKQEEEGNSPEEQKATITRYAAKHSFKITEWFQESSSAAKQGRKEFCRMTKLARQRKGVGIIFYKVDRSARNMTDWSAIGRLMDDGIDIQFAHEALDLSTRAGRLQADLLAVIATDFSRNNSQVVKDGMARSQKEGFYPSSAPPGYVNNGRKALKTIHPKHGPLMRKGFELYASEQYPFIALAEHLELQGLRNHNDNSIPFTQLAKLLKNPFYYGKTVINGHCEVGKHRPLISKTLFDRCQAVAEGRSIPNRIRSKTEHHFRRLIRCAACNYNLTAERQRDHIYYRCHRRSCRGTSIREEYIFDQLRSDLITLLNYDELRSALKELINRQCVELRQTNTERLSKLTMQRGNVKKRKQTLLDAYLDKMIDQDTYEHRHSELETQIFEMSRKIEEIRNFDDIVNERIEAYFELLKALSCIAKSQNVEKVRELLKRTTSNILIHQKTVRPQWCPAFQIALNNLPFYLSAPPSVTGRTCTQDVTEGGELLQHILEIVD